MSEAKTFRKLLDQEANYFMNLKRLAELQLEVLRTCTGKTIQNDLLYEQLLFASVDGLFTRLHNYGERLVGFLNAVKAGHLSSLKRNNMRGLEVEPKEMTTDAGNPRAARDVADHFSEQLKAIYLKVYNKLFPGVAARGGYMPNAQDIDLLIDRLRAALKPIKDHRDTVVAHWDDQPIPATIKQLEDAVAHIQELLGGLYRIAFLAQHDFELGGIAARVNDTSVDFCALILGEFRVRAATPKDMNEIFLMGFDVWGEGQPEEKYLEGCRASAKYAAGTWYVMEDRDGHPISSVIVSEKLGHGKAQPAIGIGSLATKPTERKKGHGRQLVWDLMRLLESASSAKVFYLYADVDPNFYEELGFNRLPARLQTKSGSTAMIRTKPEVLRELLEDPTYHPPAYF